MIFPRRAHLVFTDPYNVAVKSPRVLKHALEGWVVEFHKGIPP